MIDTKIKHKHDYQAIKEEKHKQEYEEKSDQLCTSVVVQRNRRLEAYKIRKEANHRESLRG